MAKPGEQDREVTLPCRFRIGPCLSRAVRTHEQAPQVVGPDVGTHQPGAASSVKQALKADPELAAQPDRLRAHGRGGAQHLSEHRVSGHGAEGGSQQSFEADGRVQVASGLLGSVQQFLQPLRRESLDEGLAVREVPVGRTHPDPGAPRQRVQPERGVTVGEPLAGRVQQSGPISSSVRPQRCRAGPS